MTEEEKLDQQKMQLIEKLGVIMEQKHKLAPLAARIMSTLVLNGRHGVTFDELVRNLNASKSTISTHLDHLQAGRKVKYFTKPGDRKRYFVINPQLTLAIIDETVQAWENEQKVQEEILHYKERKNELCEEKVSPFDLEFQKNIMVFLQEATVAIKKLKKQIIKETRKESANK